MRLPSSEPQTRKTTSPEGFVNSLMTNLACFMTDLPRQLGKSAVGLLSSEEKNGGEGGIRTLGRLSPTRAFQARAFDHSATSPGDAARTSGRGAPTAEGVTKSPLSSWVNTGIFPEVQI